MTTVTFQRFLELPNMKWIFVKERWYGKKKIMWPDPYAWLIFTKPQHHLMTLTRNTCI